MKGRYIGLAVYDGQPIGVQGYKILRNDNDPNSVVVCRDVYFVEMQFAIDKPLPLAEPIRVTRWDAYHDDDSDFDADEEGHGYRNKSSSPEETENNGPREHEEEADTPDLESDTTDRE